MRDLVLAADNSQVIEITDFNQTNPTTTEPARVP